MGIKLTNSPSAAPWQITRHGTRLLLQKLEKPSQVARSRAGASSGVWERIMFTVSFYSEIEKPINPSPRALSSVCMCQDLVIFVLIGDTLN